MTRFRKAAALSLGLVAAIGLTLGAYAAGNFVGQPMIGLPSYCTSNVTGITLPGGQGPFGVVPGSTQGTGVGICGNAVPAGPALFTGNEYFPVDLGPISGNNGAPVQSAVVSLLQVGQGPFVLTTTAGNLQIGANTMWFVENATTTNPTITLPANPIAGQTVHIVLGANLTTGITTAAGAGASACVPACGAIAGVVAGTTYTFVFNAGNTSWYRVQ